MEKDIRKPAPKKVRTVRDLAHLAEDIGVQPSILIWLEGLSLPELHDLSKRVRAGSPDRSA